MEIYELIFITLIAKTIHNSKRNAMENFSPWTARAKKNEEKEKHRKIKDGVKCVNRR